MGRKVVVLQILIHMAALWHFCHFLMDLGKGPGQYPGNGL